MMRLYTFRNLTWAVVLLRAMKNLSIENKPYKRDHLKFLLFCSTINVPLYTNIIFLSTGQPVETMIIKSGYFAYRQFMGFECTQVFVPVIIESVH